MTKRIVLAAVLLLATAASSFAYRLIEFRNPRQELVKLKWGTSSFPVPFFVSNRRPPDFTLDQMIAACRASFQTWQDVETAEITFRYAGTTNAQPFVFFDFINTLGFASDPELERAGVLGATSWIVFTFTGEIAESDIYFSREVPWSVSAAGTAGRFDFQSVVTHECGHFFGLGHSGAGVMQMAAGRTTLLDGSAIMWPFAFPRGSITGRTLTPDDKAGAATLYPAAGFRRTTGQLSGRVTKNGRGLLGVNVIAFNPFGGETIGFFTDEQGNFTIEGLKPGPHIVRVNPISAPTSPDDFNFPEDDVDLDFRDAIFSGRAEVRPGVPTPNINFEVRP
jgi:hypothetical protein